MLRHLSMIVFILPGALAVPGRSDVTLDGASLACRSSGTPCPDNAWRLDEPGFVGTYIHLDGPGEVSFAIRASAEHPEAGAHMLTLRVADRTVSWPLTTAADTYDEYTQTWPLPAGTYCVRIENANSAAPDERRAVRVRDITMAGCTVVNRADDSLALAAADTYIEHFRRGPMTLTLKDHSGPLARVPVRIRLKRHAFHFGTAVAGVGRGNGWVTSEHPDDLRYREFILRHFNTIVPENAGKWRFTEPERDQLTLGFLDRLIDFGRRNDLQVRMHGLLWDVSEPAWVTALKETALRGPTPEVRNAAKADLRTAISRRIEYFIRQRAGSYYEVDLVNEPVHKPEYDAIYGVDGVAEIYREAEAAVRAAGASTRLVPNEYDVLQGRRAAKDPFANWYRRHIETLRNAGAPVGGIGIQYYAVEVGELATGNAHSPSRIANVFHNLAVTGLPLSLAEFGVQPHNAVSPHRTAEMLAETMRLCFGHEKMTTLMLWGFWPPRMWHVAPAAALVDTEWNVTPAGKVWQQATGTRDWQLPGVPSWTTDVQTVTDEQGRVRFVGFYGHYEVVSAGRRGDVVLEKPATACEAFLEVAEDVADGEEE